MDSICRLPTTSHLDFSHRLAEVGKDELKDTGFKRPMTRYCNISTRGRAVELTCDDI